MLDFTDSGSFLSPRSVTGDSGELKAEDPNDAVGDGNAEREAPNMMGVTDEGADFACEAAARGGHVCGRLMASLICRMSESKMINCGSIDMRHSIQQAKFGLPAIYLLCGCANRSLPFLLVFNYEKLCT